MSAPVNAEGAAMKPSDLALAELAVDLGTIGARLLRDAASLTRVASWLSGDRASCSLARMAGVLQRYSGVQRQAYGKEVAVLAVRLAKIAEGETPKRKPRPKAKPRRADRFRRELEQGRREIERDDPRNTPEVRRLIICAINGVRPERAAQLARVPGRGQRDGPADGPE